MSNNQLFNHLLVLLALLLATTTAGTAQPASCINDSNFTNAANIRRDYVYANPNAAPFVQQEVHPEGHDIVRNGASVGPGTVTHNLSGPVYLWPVSIPAAQSKVPSMRDVGIQEHALKTFGYPVSDTQYQMIHRYNQNILLAELFDPERLMWTINATGLMQAQAAANSAANFERAQVASAIDYTATYLFNFTTEANNRWNKLRTSLFIPVAFLLLLPGAILTQVRAIIACGSSALDMPDSPFEGIQRSLIAAFLIPGTYLVISYGIDVSNAITFTIAHEYNRMFGSDMYRDALCAQIRAFPIRQPNENQNGMFGSPSTWTSTNSSTPQNHKSTFEALTSGNKVEDPCGGVIKADPNKCDERAPVLSATVRLAANCGNAALAATWNILCAFQMAYLYYLWCVGPIVAALWVWPMRAFRDALGSWCEGVVTICFWSLFWNTVILLMACFRGVDDTGTLIMSALNFLAAQAVKSSFDFAGLVQAAGQQAAGQALGQSTPSGEKANTNNRNTNFSTTAIGSTDTIRTASAVPMQSSVASTVNQNSPSGDGPTNTIKGMNLGTASASFSVTAAAAAPALAVGLPPTTLAGRKESTVEPPPTTINSSSVGFVTTLPPSTMEPAKVTPDVPKIASSALPAPSVQAQQHQLAKEVSQQAQAWARYLNEHPAACSNQHIWNAWMHFGQVWQSIANDGLPPKVMTLPTMQSVQEQLAVAQAKFEISTKAAAMTSPSGINNSIETRDTKAAATAAARMAQICAMSETLEPPALTQSSANGIPAGSTPPSIETYPTAPPIEAYSAVPAMPAAAPVIVEAYEPVPLYKSSHAEYETYEALPRTSYVYQDQLIEMPPRSQEAPAQQSSTLPKQSLLDRALSKGLPKPTKEAETKNERPFDHLPAASAQRTGRRNQCA